MRIEASAVVNVDEVDPNGGGANLGFIRRRFPDLDVFEA
jgi:hypothetical protein